MAVRLATAFIPNSRLQHTNGNAFVIENGLLCYIFSCLGKKVFVTQFCLVLIQVFLVHHVLYMGDLTIMKAFLTLWGAVTWIFCPFTLYAAMDYLNEAHTKLKFTNSENIRLLDGMHEGIIILSNPKRHS